MKKKENCWCSLACSFTVSEGYLRKIMKETREEQTVVNSHSIPTLLFGSHPPPVTITLSQSCHCAIKIHGANKQRRYHAKSAFQNELNEFVAKHNKTQLLMNGNHRQINNLSECLNWSRICIFTFARTFSVDRVTVNSFTLIEQRHKNYLLHFLHVVVVVVVGERPTMILWATTNLSLNPQNEQTSIWIYMQHRIEWWSGQSWQNANRCSRVTVFCFTVFC